MFIISAPSVGGKKSVGRVRRGVKDAAAILAIALLVLEEPNVEDLLRVLREVHRLQQADRPADVLLGVAADFFGRVVAENDKRRLDDDGEPPAGNLLLQPQDVLGEIGGRERPRRRRLGGQFAGLQPQADSIASAAAESGQSLRNFARDIRR